MTDNTPKNTLTPKGTLTPKSGTLSPRGGAPAAGATVTVKKKRVFGSGETAVPAASTGHTPVDVGLSTPSYAGPRPGSTVIAKASGPALKKETPAPTATGSKPAAKPAHVPSQSAAAVDPRLLAEQRVSEIARARAAEDVRRREENLRRDEEAKAKAAQNARASAAAARAVEKAEHHQPGSAGVINPATVPTGHEDRRDHRHTAAPVREREELRRPKHLGRPQGKDNAPRSVNALLNQGNRRFGGKKHKHHDQPQLPQEKILREVIIPEVITVQELANRMAERGGDVVKKLMMLGQMVTLTQSIDAETAALIVEEFGHKYRLVADSDVETDLLDTKDAAETLLPRPPVVTVMGHVDHGKTSLLDALRETDVAGGEAGGITQHIGAYQIKTKTGRVITFLDTPGHEAFTAMRARGAKVTDVVILVVAGDDGVMPQTIEAIKHAKAANVPIVVAVNKMDKPGSNIDRVKQELLTHDLVAEDFGGDTVFVPVSAKQRTNLDTLEEMVGLQADVLQLKANPNRKADGFVVESQLDKGRGPVATVIVSGGTLRVGDVLVAGTAWGRVRALVDDNGKRIEVALPATPVEIIGLQTVPEAGDTFTVVSDEKKAREVASYRDRKKREKEQASHKVSLENLFDRINTGDMKELSVVVKADVQGSVEAISDSLQKLSTPEIKVRVLHGAVGVITESDVMLSSASKALIVGFNVRANPQARAVAERDGIEIRYYSIIYQLIDEVKNAMVGLLAPKEQENILGHAQVREVFRVSKVGTIAGCMVTDGIIRRSARVRLLRDGIVLHDGKLSGLKRMKDDAKEVKEGFECGMSLEKFDDIRNGDTIECYEIQQIAATLESMEAGRTTAKE